LTSLFSGLGYNPAALPADIDFAWMGNLTSTSITIKARSGDTPTLLVATNEALTDADEVSGTEGSDDIWTFEATGLTADTEYHWSFDGWPFTGRFRTPATGQTSFSIVAASCAGSPPGGADADYEGPGATSDTPAWARIEDRQPLLFINLGDWGYPDITSGQVAAYRQALRDNIANDRQASLLRNVPYAYTWSDHDYSDADSNGSYAGKAAPQQVYREYIPHYELPDAEAIYQTFSIGRVQFYLLDLFSEASDHGAVDNASKTFLGATQKQWLKDELQASSAQVHVIAVNWPWNEPSGWGAFSTERRELADFFEANDLTAKILLLQADWHLSAFDDGTNSQYTTAGTGLGPPIFHVGPLDQDETAASGDYSEGTVYNAQQYTEIEFVDAGSTITAIGTVYACPDTSTETEELTYSHVFNVESEPPSGGGKSRVYVGPRARVEKVSDDGWIHIVL
jgi:phosphodiesterase/alkaline phosphatase D-like protein